MGKLIYSTVSKKPEDRPLIDKVLIFIVIEKVKHDFIGGHEKSMEREPSRTRTREKQQDSRIRDLESKIRDHQYTINEQEVQIRAQEEKIRNQADQIRDLKDTIEDTLQQNATLKREIKKHSDVKKAKVTHGKEFDKRDFVEPPVLKHTEGGTKPKVIIKHY